MTDLVERLRHRLKQYEAASDDCWLYLAEDAVLDADVVDELETNHVSYRHKREMQRLKDALEAAQAQAAEVRRETIAEAVAWRWKMPEDEFWTFSQREPNHDNWPTMIYERLYARPAAIRALTDAAKGDRT